MLAAERHNKIVEVVNLRSSIRVSELSELFSVTEETIRRDLEKLEKEKKLLRRHGGAIKLQSKESETHLSEREITNIKEKKAIALEAIKNVQEGERIILDASSTAWYMAQALPNNPLTVITNSIKIAIELSRKEKIEVISTGGVLLSKSLSYVGPLAERSLNNYFVDKSFLSCEGIHLEYGLSDSNESQAILKRKMIDIAKETIIMVDFSKFGVRAFSNITQLHPNFIIITDSSLSSNILHNIKENNIKVNVANDISNSKISE